MTSEAGTCTTCELTARRDNGSAPLWDSILRVDGWDVVHSFNTSHEGWIVLVARRHVEAVADLTDDEAVELGLLIKRVSAALHTITGCIKTYVIQFAEATGHQHVHVHVVPRSTDHPEATRGTGVFSMLGVNSDDAIGEDRMNEIGQLLRQELT